MQSQGGGLARPQQRQAFAQWTDLKIKLDAKSHPDFYFYEREVWWTALGQNIGHEVNGKNANFERPALILKRYTQKTCLIIPLTTVIKPSAYYQFSIELNGIKNAALLDQTRSISSKRLSRKLGKINITTFQKIGIAYFNLIKIDNPALGGVAELPDEPVNDLEKII